MLIDRAKKLNYRIEEFVKVKNAAQDALPFETRAQQFSDTAKKIRHLQTALAALKEIGVAIRFWPSNGTDLAEKASQLKIRLAEDPAAIHDPPFDLKHAFVDRLNAIANSGLESATSAWGDFVLKRAYLESEETLNVLAALPQLKAGVDRIRDDRSELVRLSEALPDDPKASLDRINDLVDELQASWSKLDASDIPQDAIEFIRLSASQGAPLSALKRSVIDWLTERGLADSFRIRLR